MLMLLPRFTFDDQQHAFAAWGANCGPGSIAAMVGLTLDEVRPHMGDFEAKQYTNPTLMWETLNRLGVRWQKVKPPLTWPEWGLARIQWHGPWTAPGVPARVAYRHTHWVGAHSTRNSIGIFDINALSNGTGWCSLEDWGETLVPWLLAECEPGADGIWSLTHVVEIATGGGREIVAEWGYPNTPKWHRACAAIAKANGTPEGVQASARSSSGQEGLDKLAHLSGDSE